MSVLLSLQPGSLPEGYTPETFQEFYNRMFKEGRAIWPDAMTIVNRGSSAPSAANQIYPWIRVDPGTSIIEGVYTYYNGLWCRPHPTPASGDERRLWVGSVGALTTYDGGDGGATVTAYTGPMWEVDTDFAAVFPLGVGTLPSGTAVAVGGTGGEETHVLTIAELATHNHPLNPDNRQDDQHDLSPGTAVGDFGGSGMYVKEYNVTGDTGSGDAHNNMPPYRGVYFIKRTARIYITA